MTKNIVIIGMPGAGKTSVARAVAEKLNRPMIDIDTEIIQKHGNIAAVFETQGEKAFRAYEKKAVLAAAKEKAVVIATGIMGSILAPTLIRLFKVKSPIAAGVAIGTCSHAVGPTKALEIADYSYVLSTGKIVRSGEGRSLLTDASVRSAYLG